MQSVQRNDPCPCGSGKKYKKCCMGTNEQSSFVSGSNFVRFALIAILLASVFLRFYGFGQPHKFTFDEGLYSELIAEQLKENPLNYSTQEAYRQQLSLGQRVPEYLDRPLFKHPPLYSYLIALSYILFGSSHTAAVSISILFGCLMVFIAFLLGRKLYDERIGLLAAFYLCIDPIHWVCSEKIWMETTMCFFILLALYLFVLGWKKRSFMIVSGLSVGLAMLTKYPGMLALVAIILFALCYERALFKQKHFWILCIVSILVFLPWIIWNRIAYGNFSEALMSAHIVETYWNKALGFLTGSKSVLFAMTILAAILFTVRKKIKGKGKLVGVIGTLIFIAAFIAIPLVREIILGALKWPDSFKVGWSYPFADASWPFYIKRLGEFSPTFLFSYAAMFFILGKDQGDRLLILSSVLFIAVFSLIGSYQSRYILPAIPLLLILSARWQCWAYDCLTQQSRASQQTSDTGAYKTLLKISLIGVTLYFILKTARTGWLLAIGPDFGYF